MSLTEPVQRRRGKALEDALLDAAWEELVEHGYAGLTFEGVARRAGTSRPVVYRRWATKPELVSAAVVHQGDVDNFTAPDTGSLRGDLVALLTEVNERRSGLITLMAVRLSAYFEETGTNLADLRLAFLGRRSGTMNVVFERAIARGEIDASRLTPRIAALPSDLFRHEVFMTLRPASLETIAEIIDTIFLPLVQVRPASE